MNDADSSWPLVRSWIAAATNPTRLTLATPEAGLRALSQLPGVTERSPLGALTHHAAGLLVDDWLLLLGAGGDGHPSITDFNGARPDPPAIPGALIVAVDMLGGAFAIQGGGLPVGEPGEVGYLAPDTLAWMDCGLGHSAFVQWALNDDLDTFYADLRWSGWRMLTATLTPGQGVSAYPFPWSEEGQQPGVSRRAVPIREVYGVLVSTAHQLG